MTALRDILRLRLVAAVAVVLVVSVLSQAPPASAATKRSLTLSVSPSTVTAGATVTVKGRLTRSPRGTTVALQRRAGRSWVTVKNARTRAAGRYTYRLTARSSTTFRARVAKRGALRAATSKSRTVRVVSPAPVAPPAPPAPLDLLTIVSLRPDGTSTSDVSTNPSVSGDGRWVAFQSAASDLVPGDGNGAADVFLRDTLSGTTQLISRPPTGQSNGASRNPSISPNGRYVAFDSSATNLVPGLADANGSLDVWVWDRTTGEVRAVSSTGTSTGNSGSSSPSVSDNGRIAFLSRASNLSGTGHTGSQLQAYALDLEAGGITLVSRAGTSGVVGNAETFQVRISADGTTVVFTSAATNLDAVPTGGRTNVWRYRLGVDQPPRVVSRGPAGAVPNSDAANPSVSRDGRFVAFDSGATNLGGGGAFIDVFVTDTLTASTAALTAGAGHSFARSISGDGRRVAIASNAGDLVPDDVNGTTDVFVIDPATGVRAVSRNATGLIGNGTSEAPVISEDGRFVVFGSQASNLRAGDTNGIEDVYRWDALGNR